MQKWEYLFVTANWAKDNWHIQYLNGKEVANWKSSANVYDYSNKLGDEGWEMLSAPYTVDAGLKNTFGGYELNTSYIIRLIF